MTPDTKEVKKQQGNLHIKKREKDYDIKLKVQR